MKRFCMIALLALVLWPVTSPAFDDAPQVNLLYEIGGFRGYSDFVSLDCFYFDNLESKLYAADTVQMKIFEYSLNGSPIGSYSINARKMKVLSMVARDNRIFLLHDQGLSILYKDNEKLEEIHIPEELRRLSAFDKIMLDGRGILYLRDLKNRYIYKKDIADHDAEFEIMKDTRTDKIKWFAEMTDVFVDSANRMFVLYANKRRVQEYEPSGKLRGDILDRHSMSKTELYNPSMIVSDSFRRIYIFDIGNRELKIFDSIGFFKGSISPMDENGLPVFLFPKQLFIDTMDRLYILDEGDRTIKVYEVKGLL